MARKGGRGKGGPSRVDRGTGGQPGSTAGRAALASLAGANTSGQVRQVPVADLIRELTDAGNVTGGIGPWPEFRPMPRNPLDQVPFGPLNALIPQPFDPSRADTGLPEPRLTEYATAANIQLTENGPLDWQLLRDASEVVDIIRACIEVRKKHLRDLKWSFRISEEAVKAAREADGGEDKSVEDVEKELRRKYAPDIERLTKFFDKPWRSQGLKFGPWLNGLMDNYITYDARVLYPRCTRGGEVAALEIIDPSTIKLLIDHRGARPEHPFPAFQQILQGFPRGEFAAEVTEVDNEDGTVSQVMEDAYTPAQLAYYIENYRSHTPYGFSDVEQALIAAKLYLARQGWMLSEYTSGATPDTWLFPSINSATGLQANVNMTPRERTEYENALNQDLAGQTGERRTIKLAPPGFTAMQMTQEAERFKPDYDMHLVKLVCKHMGVTSTELGFSESGGLGTSGQHEGQEATTGRVGTRPDVAVVEEMINDMACTWLDAPPEVVFGFTIAEQEDEKVKDEIQVSKLVTGRITLNQARRENGDAPYVGVAEADQPMFIVGATAIMVNNIEAAQQLAAEQSQMAAEGGAALTGAKVDETKTKAEVMKDPPAPKLPEGAPAKIAKAAGMSREDIEACQREEVAYARWLRKQGGSRPRREFEFSPLMLKYWSPDRPDGWQGLPIHSIIKASLPLDPGPGGVDPKAPAPDRRWPGWAVDERLAETVAGKLIRSLTRGLGIPSLVKRVLGWGATERQDIAGRLRADPASQAVHDAVDNALTGAYEQGWMVGNRSARTAVKHAAALAESRVGVPQAAPSALVRQPVVLPQDWAAWQPGDEAAARLLIEADGTGDGLRALLERDNVRIKGIAETQLDLLAGVLADGIERGASPGELATAIQGLVADRSHAMRIALTEVNRAVSAATLDSYAAMGVKDKWWMSAFDQDVCKRCNANVAAGEIPLAERFPSGELHPPGHPRCRCALAPGSPDMDDTSWLDAVDDELRAEGLL